MALIQNLPAAPASLADEDVLFMGDSTSEFNEKKLTIAQLRSTITANVIIASTGVDKTGVASASELIHEAINALGDTPKVVVFPEGATLLCKNIYIPANTTVIATGCKFKYGGSNPDNFTFSPENSQSGIFHIYGTEGSHANNVTIIGGEYEGNRSANDWSSFGNRDCIQAVG